MARGSALVFQAFVLQTFPTPQETWAQMEATDALDSEISRRWKGLVLAFCYLNAKWFNGKGQTRKSNRSEKIGHQKSKLYFITHETFRQMAK